MKYPEVFEQLEHKIHAKVLRPYKLNDFGEEYPADLLREIYNAKSNELEYFHFNCIFDTVEPECIYYLPAMLRFMYDRRDDYDNILDPLGVFYAKGDFLKQLGSFELATDCLKEILFRWISDAATLQKPWHGYPALENGEARDKFIFDDMWRYLPAKASEIFKQWSSSNNPCWSAHLIDVFIFIMKGHRFKKPYPNFGNGILLTLWSDSKFLKKHFGLASKYWLRLEIPEYYKKDIESFSKYISTIE